MTAYEIYVLIICLLVLFLLVGLSSIFLWVIIKQSVRLIRTGVEDEKIKQEYIKAQTDKKCKICKGIEIIVSLLLCVIMCAFFAFSLYVNFRKDSFSDNIPTLKVVNSASMSTKHEKNTYLDYNQLNDQFQAFDIVLTYKAPAEKDLKLYDIIVYEVDGSFLIHRIVNIEEPNAEHPDERWFLCQGDANERPDRFPVKYDQIKGIYRGERIPFVGSFVSFMQSPAGWLCILLVVASMIATPLIERKLKKEKELRLALISGSNNPETQTAVALEEVTQEVIENVNEQLETSFIYPVRKDYRHFKQKLIDSSDIIQDRYEQVTSLLNRIDGIRVIEGKKQETFKKGRNPVARLTFRGKTLCILLALNPEEYANTKYIFTDISEFKTHTHYPMRVKLTSDRQVRWTKELIGDIITKNGYVLKEEIIAPIELEKPIEEQSVEQVVEHIVEHKFLEHLKGSRGYRRSFGQKLRRATKEVKERYKTIVSHIKNTENVREIESDHFRTFRLRNKPICKITMKGKTINVYLALNPNDYIDTKYIFEDVSHVKKYALYPMRVRLSSDRQVKWTCELLDKIFQELLVGEKN